MAYPFGAWPSLSLGALIARLTQPDQHMNDDGNPCEACELRNAGPLFGPMGEMPTRYLFRKRLRDGRRFVAILPNVPDGTVLLPSVLRTICAQLGFRPDVLGVLGDLNDPMDPLNLEPDDEDDDEAPPS